jgi:hypothetical protein
VDLVFGAGELPAPRRALVPQAGQITAFSTRPVPQPWQKRVIGGPERWGATGAGVFGG